MGKEEEVSEVKEIVENGTAPVETEGESVVDKKEEEKDDVKDMEEDSKDEEEKIETSKMDVDKEETGEPDKADVEEDSESKEDKEVEEAKSDAVEQENATKLEGEGKDKVDNVPGLSADDEKADKDAKKKVSKKKRGKKKPKAADQKPRDKKKTVEKKKEEPKTPVAPASDRPVRERKSVERLVATVEKDSGKDFRIEKGPGTALKDIPNVAYKLSKKKSEENYKLLHSILFGRRGKAPQIKSNISQFSGFVWHGNEDKQKNKIKEKLDKCVKEKLLEFCDLLDLPVTRAASRKEDVVVKLIEFLEAPHATTSDLLADKEQSSKGTKRKRSGKKSASPSGSALSKSSSKSRKRNGSASKGEEKKDSPEMENEHEEDHEEADDKVHGEKENVNGVSDNSDDEKPKQAKSEEKETDDTEAGSEEETKKRKRVPSKKSSVKKDSAEKVKTKKTITVKKSSPPPKKASSKPASSHSKVEDSDTSPKIFSRKKKTEEVKKSPTPKKSASKEKAGKKVAKGTEKPKAEKLKPSDDELKTAICEILKEADFNTATFTDILNQLVERFKTDLLPRKASIKLMIQEELTKLADEADDDEDEEAEAVKDDIPASAAGVKV